MPCQKVTIIFTSVPVYLLVPPLTKANSLEDEGIILNVEETEEQKKEVKKESRPEHQEIKEENQTEQINEPSTSSGSACPEVNGAAFSVLHIFILMVHEAKLTSSPRGSVSR